MGVIEYELLLDEERKPVLAKKNSGFSYADEVLNTPGKIAQMFMSGCNAEDLPEEHIWMLALNVKCKASSAERTWDGNTGRAGATSD